jgi:hypothetical protein
MSPLRISGKTNAKYVADNLNLASVALGLWRLPDAPKKVFAQFACYLPRLFDFFTLCPFLSRSILFCSDSDLQSSSCAPSFPVQSFGEVLVFLKSFPEANEILPSASGYEGIIKPDTAKRQAVNMANRHLTPTILTISTIIPHFFVHIG